MRVQPCNKLSLRVFQLLLVSTNEANFLIKPKHRIKIKVVIAFVLNIKYCKNFYHLLVHYMPSFRFYETNRYICKENCVEWVCNKKDGG